MTMRLVLTLVVVATVVAVMTWVVMALLMTSEVAAGVVLVGGGLCLGMACAAVFDS